MIARQENITLRPKHRGFHLITREIESAIDIADVRVGTLHLFLQHTSASLTINENADPSVRTDLENFFSDVCDHKHYFEHTYEGLDDMPAHIKSSLLGNEITIPVSNGKLNLGMWQGIYLNEHRDHASSRTIIVTIMGA
jgi:secondary thiamine-phosphate synthase enzyme